MDEGCGFRSGAKPYLAALALLLLSTQATVTQLAEHAQLRAGLRLGEEDGYYVRPGRGSYQAAFFPRQDVFENRFRQQIGAFQLVSLEFGAAGADDDVTGSLPAAAPAGPAARVYPVVNRANKGDRLVRRDGSRLVQRVDPRTGRLTRVAVRRDPPPAAPRAVALRRDHDAPAAARAAGVPLPPNVTRLVERLTPADRAGRQSQLAELSETRNRELMCLATAIYFEARGEPERGQLAVAQVVLNRVAHDFYPNTICEVVYQNQHWRNRCQFSFACDGRPDRPRNKTAWERAITIAKRAVNGQERVPGLGRSTHYHATYVRPRWIRDMIRLDRIGNHIFYRVRGWS